MEQATQTFAAVTFLVIGLSHLLQPRVWATYFQGLAAQGPRGAFVEGFLCLSFGGIIVGFHNVWHGPALGLTLIGWGQVLKGLSRFVAPELGVRVMAKASLDRAWLFRLGGAVALLLSGLVWRLRYSA